MKSADHAPAVAATSFATRARTIDHLGREQIADCPTAISELWKNSWDAYAKSVHLRIFADSEPVAVLTDNGHGMRSQDLLQRWLVIGTESKVSDYEPIDPEDRNGLPIRPRQGQKGIGRLSSAKLGSVLLLISKHRDDDFVVALIDWRMFENPYANLSDIVVATSTYSNKSDIFESLPSLINTLVGGVTKELDKWREAGGELQPAWRVYDDAWAKERANQTSMKPSRRILHSIKHLPFKQSHLEDWNGPGTAMLVYDLDDSLKALPVNGDTDLVRDEITERFERTLSNFVDPYGKLDRPEFEYRADVVQSDLGGSRTKVIVGAEKAIDRAQVQSMEHQIEGVVGEDGVFRGSIRAFGVSLAEGVQFSLPKGLALPERFSSRVGAFEIYIASMEFESQNSTHSRSEHDRYLDLAREYSGLMIYRDGLRVLPYGREDNDFFSIEYKRSKNAGRYFWNHRQMFGRIALTRSQNPNLKDKAGREGFIDNTAAKTFRAIVGNILDQSARRYFGSASEIRKPRLAEVQAANKAGRAAEEAKKLRERERKQFQKRLEVAESLLPGLLDELQAESGDVSILKDGDVSSATERLARWRNGLASIELPSQPSGTARLTPRADNVRAQASEIASAVVKYETSLMKALDQFSAQQPALLFEEQIKGAMRIVRLQIEEFQQEINALQREQFDAVRNIAKSRLESFASETEVLKGAQASGQFKLAELVHHLSALQDRWMQDNRSIFSVYISALEAVKDRIDLETLASVQVQELREASVELDRLTSLAQLGIAVEIAAHDLADFDEMATNGLRTLPEELHSTRAYRDIKLGIEGLTDQLRFLSPLRLSGDKVQRWITGSEIYEFVSAFFAPATARAGINFTSTDAFLKIKIYERPARVFPVFINLVNNSIYWVSTVSRGSRAITIDVHGSEVALLDSGPGVAAEDEGDIFRLFFTRKIRNGRGIGLYLARANLAAGGHEIRYKNKDDKPQLDGAAFYIRFKDADLGVDS